MNNSWSEEQKKDFVFHYENTHFKENNSNSFTKCNFKRQSMHQLIQGAQQLTSNEATCKLLRNKLREYSAVVDKQDGVNNYANGVLDLMSHNSNDAKSWSSQANASDLLKQFLKPLPGNCHNSISEGCSAQKPSKTELEAFLSKKNVPDSLSVLRRPANSVAATIVPRRTFATNDQVAPFVSGKSLNVPSKRPAESSSKIAPQGSRVMNAIESRVFGTGRNVGSVKNQIQQKPQQAPSFRTAGTELKLQNAKKYGQQGATNSGAGDSLSYGNNKKSLGGRSRSVNSKFVPPVKSDSQDDVQSEPSSCNDDVEDERLRLIDPKIVELVRSEIMDHGPPVEWDDIAGLHFAKATIQEIVVLPMLRPDIFTGLRRPPKGILLFGPPGTGKTLIGKCIASQSNSTFFNISASSLTSKWVGEGEKMVRTLFTLASVYQPAVVFIDEIDSLLSQRSDTEHESSRRIKTEFLVQLDGAGTGEDDRILVIGATNRPQELDEAARRRLVKRLYIPLPDHQARCQIVQRLMSTERNELSEEQIQQIADLTDGYSGADMKVVCQEASLGPIRSISFTDMQHIALNQVRPVTVDDFTSALSRVRSSVSPRDLEGYVTWDQTYGSGGAPK